MEREKGERECERGRDGERERERFGTAGPAGADIVFKSVFWF